MYDSALAVHGCIAVHSMAETQRGIGHDPALNNGTAYAHFVCKDFLVASAQILPVWLGCRAREGCGCCRNPFTHGSLEPTTPLLMQAETNSY